MGGVEQARIQMVNGFGCRGWEVLKNEPPKANMGHVYCLLFGFALPQKGLNTPFPEA